MKVINLYGGPGTGKSTTAAGLFYVMKTAGFKVELVTEYAKQLTYDKRHNILKNQEYIFAKQFSKLRSLKNQVEYVITDSPILMQAVYLPENYELPSLGNVLLEAHNMFDSIDIFLKRNIEHHAYQEYGRNQTLEEAVQIDNQILNMLNEKLHSKFNVVEITEEVVYVVLNLIERNHNAN